MKDLPKNKELFKRLIPFTQKIISLCQNNGLSPVIYGSFAQFVYTKDKNLNVNDIDILLPKSDFPKLIKLLKRERIKFRYLPQYFTCIIEKGNLKVEVDEAAGYKTLTDESLKRDIFNKVDFYGIKINMVTLNQFEEIYSCAYNRSRDSKQKIMNKIEHLEKFIGRRIKNSIKVEIKENKHLTRADKDLINTNRVKEFGKGEVKDFKKDYEPKTLWFFVKDNGKVVALGGLRPIAVKYLGKTYNLGGICSIISIIKGKGYGKILMSFMADYSERTGKTLLGFTGKTEFFKKAYFDTKKDFIKRFVYKNPKTGEEIIDNDGDGIYYGGKDKFISKVLSGKKPVYINVLHW